EVYDPASEIWSYTSRLADARHNYHTATLLPDGRVLVVGGVEEGADQLTFPYSSAELYEPEAAPVTPRITSASVSGKKLFVVGENFAAGAVILVNGVQQLTLQPAEDSQTTLIGKRAGKKVMAGDKLQVRNPNGSLSEEFTFTGS